MAISYPLSTPTTIGIESIEIRAMNSVATSQSPFTYKQQIVSHGGQRWEASINIPTVRRDLAASWKAFLVGLKGQTGTFLLSDPDYSSPRGSISDVTLLNKPGFYVDFVGEVYSNSIDDTGLVVDGASQTGSTLNVISALPSETGIFLAGDYIQLGQGSAAKLYQILQDVDTDGDGKAELDIWPDLRASPSDGQAVIYDSPKGVFRLKDSMTSWNINNASAYGISFEAVESLT